MGRAADLALTAVAPAVWGTTYLVTTEWLPQGYPLTVAALRALPAGLLLMLVMRQFPPRDWLGRVFMLGTLNFTIFWGLLFVAAYRLPGGAAATIGALQPLIVLVFARSLLNQALRPSAVAAALAGAAGVALMLVGPDTAYDPLGVAAAVAATVSMSAGTVLSRKWQPEVPVLAFTAWQLTAGGLLLSIFALLLEPRLPGLTFPHVAGFLWLGLVGAALTYGLWLRGIARLEPQTVSMLGMLSPVVAVALGWLFLGEALGPFQVLGAVGVLASIWVGQRASRPVDRS
jgi:probable blue pigment (indigoidine) exporter